MQPCEALNKHLAAANAKGIKKQSVASTILWEKNARGKGDKNASHTAKQKWRETPPVFFPPKTSEKKTKAGKQKMGEKMKRQQVRKSHDITPPSATYDDADFVVHQPSTMERINGQKEKKRKGFVISTQ